MHKSTSLVMCTMIAMAFSASAAARGGSNGGGMGSGMGGGFSHGSPVGPSSNSQALENSNGRFAQDRDQGLDRAEDRMSTQGREHEKASDAGSKDPRHDAPRAAPHPSSW